MDNGPYRKPPTSDIRKYYYKLINQQFRDLQLDANLKNKSVFDLIDYCEQLYENSTDAINGDLDHICNYIKGYLIFNYFINSFIMLHFQGFDQFISTNEYDFIIYLNVFAFYNTDELIKNKGFSFPLAKLRALILEYLDERSLLKFDVEELYRWLYEYIEYLKQKDRDQLRDDPTEDLGDRGDSEDESEPETDSSEPRGPIMNEEKDSDDDLYTETLTKSRKRYNLNSDFAALDVKSTDDAISNGKSSSLGVADDIARFTSRYPSIRLVPLVIEVPSQSESDSEAPDIDIQSDTDKSERPNNRITERPPIPTSFPPGLPLIDKAKSTDQLPKQTPYPRNDLVDQAPYPLSDVAKPPLKASRTEPVRSMPTVSPSIPQLFTRAPAPVPRSIPPVPQSMPPVPQSLPPVPQSMPPVPQAPMPLYLPPQSLPQMPPSVPPPGPAGPPGFPGPGPYNQYYYPNGYSTPVVPAQQLPHFYQGQPQYYDPNYHQQHQEKKTQYMKQHKICGLKNFGSSCYINSTIQLLFGVDEFKGLFTNLKYNHYIQDPLFKEAKKSKQRNSKDTVLLAEAISGLLKSFNSHPGASIAPTKFIRISSLLKPDFNIPYEQQDAQEFLLFVLDRLHEELSNKKVIKVDQELNILSFEQYLKKWNIDVQTNEVEGYFKWYKQLIEFEGNSPIHDMFEGHLQNKLVCNKCHHQSINYSPFTILSLPIPYKDRQLVDLSDCLKYYTQDEILSGENAWNCPKCHHKEEEPNSLDNHPVFTKKPGIFKLSRRSKSPSKDKKDKKSIISSSTKKLHFLKLPPVLFIHLSRFSMFNQTDKLNTEIIYPLELRFNNRPGDPNSLITYRLCGAINHYGTLKSGHYTSVVDKGDEYWCNFDDELVGLNISMRGKSHSKDVYVLCYEKVHR